MPPIQRSAHNAPPEMADHVSQDDGSATAHPEMPPNQARTMAGTVALLATGVAAWYGEGWFAAVFLIAFLLALVGEVTINLAFRAFFRYCDEWDRRASR